MIFIDGEEFYSATEMAKLVNRDADYLREMARGRRGKTLPHRKKGRFVYFNLLEVQQFFHDNSYRRLPEPNASGSFDVQRLTQNNDSQALLNAISQRFGI